MANKQIPVIQISKQSLPLARRLSEDFSYLWAASDVGEIIPKQPVFKDGQWNPAFRRAVTLIDGTCPWLTELGKLAHVPANRIFYNEDDSYPSDAMHILELKGAFPFSFADIDVLATNINHYFFNEMFTYKLNINEIVLDANFTGTVRQVGNYKREIAGDFGDEWVPLASYQSVIWMPRVTGFKVSVECQTTGSLEVMAKVVTFTGIGSDLAGVYQASGDELISGVNVDVADQPRGAQLSLYVRGSGTAELGTAHFRRSRGPYGEPLVGAHAIVDEGSIHGQLRYYFDAGDLKPPLNVYFSGWQSAEIFEGSGMMGRMNAPHILFMDTRLEGGSFYLGSHQLEQQVLTVITDTLKGLGFTSNQLVLSGLSMGTYAAMYYGASLAPHAVILGKPLTNLGTIAKAVRLQRPNDFATSLDMVLANEGGVTTQDLKRMDDRFWRVFKQGDWTKTTFVFSYMRNDDYDPTGFTKTRSFLKERFPNTRVWSKGFVGRHNDETHSIVVYFLNRYYHILRNDFGRG